MEMKVEAIMGKNNDAILSFEKVCNSISLLFYI